MCWRCCCTIALRSAPTWALHQISESVRRTAWPVSDMNNFQTYLSFTLQHTGDSGPLSYDSLQVQSPLSLSPPRPHTVLFVRQRKVDSQCEVPGKNLPRPTPAAPYPAEPGPLPSNRNIQAKPQNRHGTAVSLSKAANAPRATSCQSFASPFPIRQLA